MSEPRKRKRVAILISGRGSNMQALIESAKDPRYPAEIVGVFSNKPDAAGLSVAAAAGIAIKALSHRDYTDRASFDAAIEDVLAGWQPDIVCLAGFMRLLTAEFTTHWAGRLINIHPSLLPAFKGLDTHEQALAAGVSEHGCTVHFVTPRMDEGPIILQSRVPVRPGDTPERLAERVLEAEHEAYPRALAMLARGEVAFPLQ
ncbi:MAG: phosphoribosylglycinamide formyltransferase [Devosia sp.]